MFTETIKARAKVRIHHERAYDFDEKTGLWHYKPAGEDEEAFNILTDTGRVQLHTFAYGTLPRSNGFNYIALTNDATPPAATDTVLTSELVGNGLTRVQGIVALPVGSGNVTTVTNIFIYTGLLAQGVQKTALFDSPAAGVMNHEIAFTPRVLATNDTFSVTFSITLG